MSRSGYVDDCDDNWAEIRWRGAIASAMSGRRGQAFLRETLAAMDAMPVKELGADSLVTQDGAFCTLGVVGAKLGIDMAALDPDDADEVGKAFGIAPAMAREIVYQNDENGWRYEERPWVMRTPWDYPTSYRVEETPAERWTRMRAWVVSHIAAAPEVVAKGVEL